jgi:sugar phosphate isomerase/epimerase
VCLDVGHEARAGSDPVAFIRQHGARIYDVHIKNIKIDARRNLAVEGPRGDLDVPGILKALNYDRGNFRIPGNSCPFAMFHPLTNSAIFPSYFGFAFD